MSALDPCGGDADIAALVAEGLALIEPFDPTLCACGLGHAGFRDVEAGYDHCMFCVEQGDPENHSVHDVLWDRMLDAMNSAF